MLTEQNVLTLKAGNYVAGLKLFLTKKSIIGQSHFAAISALQQSAKTKLYLLTPQSFWVKVRTIFPI